MVVKIAWRAALTGAAAALCLLLPQGVALAAPEPDKIDKSVLADLKADDKATFWVKMKGEANLSAARRATSKDAKAAAVFKTKKGHAASAQAELRRLLAAQNAEFAPYWIVNAVRVTGAGVKLAGAIADLPEVESILPVRTLAIPKPEQGRAEARTKAAVEWNVDRVNAPRVWSELGSKGEGIVVGHIDSGADFTHPEIAAQYRGRGPDGSYDHDYNWFDPAGICPSPAPCDNNDHGTHTMGTMVGANGIGVAPAARWIAAKGCETDFCSDESLIRSGQWMAAPTDLNGQNERPDLAPDIVNNSWGGPGFDPWYKTIVESWIAAGIFPAFSNGNAGPACTTSGSPGQYVISYSAGGLDINNALYARSSKGAGENGEIKPNIAAPGVNVRSSVPGGGYAAFTGTSMASPHVAATVALMWSAAPSLQGNVEATRPLLDSTAIDVDDTSCGGTAADNNVWGEGRLDSFAAVQSAPRDGLGDLRGTVTAGGAPVANAEVSLTGPLTRTVFTGEDGTYAVPRLLPGDYQVSASRFGYTAGTANVTVAAGQTATADVTMTRNESGTVSGLVSIAGRPEPGATLAVAGTPVQAVTGADGRYRFTIPHGTYDVTITPRSRCATASTTVQVTVAGDVVKDVDLPLRGDGFGYTCESRALPYVEGTEKLALTGDDEAQQVTLPFTFPFYGAAQTKAWITTNGYASFAAEKVTTGSNGTLPTTGTPNNALYAYFDDLVADAESGVYTATQGAAPNRVFVVEWRNVKFYSDAAMRISVSMLLGENGTVSYRYKDIESAREQGNSATIGVENAAGTDALLYSFNTAAVSSGQAVTVAATRHGLVTGTVTDANDARPIAGATVKVGEAATFTTGQDGTFYGQVPAGDHKVEVSKEHYGTFTQDVTVAPLAFTRVDTALITGAVSASVGELAVVMPTGVTRSRSFELTNLGAPADYTVTSDAAWLTAAPAAGRLAKGEKATVNVTVSSQGVQPGTVRAGKLTVKSNSGRQPVLEIAVNVVVPKHQVALDVGASRQATDAQGDVWAADRKYTQGGHGWVANQNRTADTRRTIAGTTEQTLFRTARENLLEYRFDNVPNGTYTVELGFAEITSKRPGSRVFDVIVEGQLAVPALDLALEVGTYTAANRSYTVKVTDGQLNVRFARRDGQPIVNAVRISERPDKN
ncbi:S8 family serine peptidase [Nonomuraea sp. NPDC050790]|uniref:S8 family serine peptidase n=1 Tax=Nonomuraea sp. NPDC050790 TaxID=3364371 RepID=UPI00379B335E